MRLLIIQADQKIKNHLAWATFNVNTRFASFGTELRETHWWGDRQKSGCLCLAAPYQ